MNQSELLLWYLQSPASRNDAGVVFQLASSDSSKGIKGSYLPFPPEWPRLPAMPRHGTRWSTEAPFVYHRWHAGSPRRPPPHHQHRGFFLSSPISPIYLSSLALPLAFSKFQISRQRRLIVSARPTAIADRIKRSFLRSNVSMASFDSLDQQLARACSAAQTIQLLDAVNFRVSPKGPTGSRRCLEIPTTDCGGVSALGLQQL